MALLPNQCSVFLGYAFALPRFSPGGPFTSMVLSTHVANPIFPDLPHTELPLPVIMYLPPPVLACPNFCSSTLPYLSILPRPHVYPRRLFLPPLTYSGCPLLGSVNSNTPAYLFPLPPTHPCAPLLIHSYIPTIPWHRSNSKIKCTKPYQTFPMPFPCSPPCFTSTTAAALKHLSSLGSYS